MRFLLILCFAVIGCSEKEKEQPPIGFLSYPYVADKERSDIITTGFKKIKVGDSLSEVVAIMGRPDELNPTLDNINWDKRVGYSLVYVIRRDKKNGSEIEKNEKLVRIHFNFENFVTKIHSKDSQLSQ